MKNFDPWNEKKKEIDEKIIVIGAHEREIWWASLGLNVGVEANGKHEEFERPILIIKKFNKEMMWIIPLTSQVKSSLFYQEFYFQDRVHYAALSQIRTISTKRLLRKSGTISKEDFEKINLRVASFLQTNEDPPKAGLLGGRSHNTDYDINAKSKVNIKLDEKLRCDTFTGEYMSTPNQKYTFSFLAEENITQQSVLDINQLLAQLTTRAGARVDQETLIQGVKKDMRIAVVHHGSTMVAMGIVSRVPRLTCRVCEIQDVVVDQEHRRQGIGPALVNMLLNEARVRYHAGHVNLTSKPERKEANELYLRVGFKLRTTNCYRYVIGG